MFKPKTERIKKLAEPFPKVILELEDIFGKSANIYIDWQNVIHWQERLGWHFHLKRMKQFFDFDVEIGRDMQKDFESNGVQNYILWSTDSDFADPITQIKNDGKNAVIFAVSGKVAPELDATGVFVFDVRKIREFICWPREIPQNIKSKTGIL